MIDLERFGENTCFFFLNNNKHDYVYQSKRVLKKLKETFAL